MKKFLRYANLIALAAGIVGALLMCWLFASGTDDRGLYPANHPAWVIVGILTVAVVAFFWLLSRQAGINRTYRQNFPASMIAAAGYLAGAVGLLITSLSYLGADASGIQKLGGFVGTLSGISLLPAAFYRLRGKKCKLPLHCLPCIFFTLNLFFLGQQFGSEPELYRYLYTFWATVTMVPACYYLWGFDVNLGKRPACMFWCLVAGYCNLVATVGGSYWLLHLGVGIWMLCALPLPGYLPKQQRHAPDVDTTVAAPVTEVIPDIPAPVADATVDAPVPTVPEAVPSEEIPQNAENPLHIDLPNPESILEELLRDFGSQENP